MKYFNKLSASLRAILTIIGSIIVIIAIGLLLLACATFEVFITLLFVIMCTSIVGLKMWVAYYALKTEFESRDRKRRCSRTEVAHKDIKL